LNSYPIDPASRDAAIGWIWIQAGALMVRIFLAVVAAGLLILIGGALMLGAYPPTPQPHPVEKVLPNDKFSTH
jgi:hypothetical protein